MAAPADSPTSSLTEPVGGLVLPSWLASLLTHVVVLGLSAALMQVVPRMAPGDAGGRAGGIALASPNAAGGASYFTDGEKSSSTAASQSTTNPARSTLAAALPGAEPTSQPGAPSLPTTAPSMGLEGVGAVGKSGAKGSGAGDLLTGKGKSGWGKGVQTGVFGAQGTGTSFVYVFDRSGSMEGRPLAAAQKELIKSLEHLDRTHQFQIVFYNQAPSIFSPLPGANQSMVFADKANKAHAARFVSSIIADGATRHLDALKLALGLRPDVIFFLTDADDPRMTQDELDQVRRINRGTSINCVEFGVRAGPEGDNFLRRLARQNDGEHVFVDVRSLP